jgi:hypothetical protein
MHYWAAATCVHKSQAVSVFSIRVKTEIGTKWKKNFTPKLALNPTYGEGVLVVVTSAGGLTLGLVLLIMKEGKKCQLLPLL